MQLEEIQAAAQASIVSGKGDGRFDPKSNATRAEALQIILNVLELNPQLKTLLDSLRNRQMEGTSRALSISP